MDRFFAVTSTAREITNSEDLKGNWGGCIISAFYFLKELQFFPLWCWFILYGNLQKRNFLAFFVFSEERDENWKLFVLLIGFFINKRIMTALRMNSYLLINELWIVWNVGSAGFPILGHEKIIFIDQYVTLSSHVHSIYLWNFDKINWHIQL